MRVAAVRSERKEGSGRQIRAAHMRWRSAADVGLGAAENGKERGAGSRLARGVLGSRAMQLRDGSRHIRLKKKSKEEFLKKKKRVSQKKIIKGRMETQNLSITFSFPKDRRTVHG